MAWRVANSLQTLLGQLNARWPNRNKVSDGSIGDENHQNRNSDHNPWYGPGIVTARDFTHDPGDLDCHWLAGVLVANRDPRIKYVIWDRRIWNPTAGWRVYSGANPHTSHLHLSVVASPACDSTAPWAGITSAVPPEENMAVTKADADKIFGEFMWGNVFEADTGENFASWIKRVIRLMLTGNSAILADLADDPELTAERISQLQYEASVRALRDNPQKIDTDAIADEVVQQIGSRTDIAPETVQEIANASAAAIAARMAN